MVLRADFHLPLRYFRHFQIWHFYHSCSPDIRTEELGPNVIRFNNLIDLTIKLLRLKPDLIQGGEPYDFPLQLPVVISTLLCYLFRRIPYYFPTFENMPPEKKFANIRRCGIRIDLIVVKGVKLLAGVYARRAKLIFCVNRGAEQNIQALGVPSTKILRLLYATWGVDLEHFRPERDGSEPDFGPQAILFVGRFAPEKGIFNLLSAFELIKPSFPDAQLVIIGDGILRDQLKLRAQRSPYASSIHIHGYVPNTSLPPFFRAARITVTPSVTTGRLAEQVCMVNIQSMACGIPVISTRSGSIPEFVAHGETGLLVEENDVQQLSAAITRLLTDAQLYQHLARSARRYAEENYDMKKNIAKVEKYLLELFSDSDADNC